MWGKQCMSRCNQYCRSEQCFPGNGSCVWGCDTRDCLDDICDSYSAVCTIGCTKHRAGKYCNKYNLAYDGIPSHSPEIGQSSRLAIDGNRSERSCLNVIGGISWLQIDLKDISIFNALYVTLGDSITNSSSHSIYATNTSGSWVGEVELFNGISNGTDISIININAVARYVMYVPPVVNERSQVHVCEIEIVGCPPTQYGFMCNISCPDNCHGPCDLDTGKCIFGCLNGWIGERCETACDDWYFGNNCEGECNCRSQPCNKNSGKCPDGGCKMGWYTPSCNKECSNGRFGFNCEGSCKTCINMSCDTEEGNCTNGCIQYHSGPRCQITYYAPSTENQASETVAFFGGGVSAAILVIVLVVVIFLLYKKRSTTEENHAEDELTKLGHKTSKSQDDCTIFDSKTNFDDVADTIPNVDGTNRTMCEETEEIPTSSDDDTNVYTNVPSQPAVRKHKIQVEDLMKYIKEKQACGGFKEEFEILPKGLIHQHTEGSKEENKVKNRFLTTFPYDHSRVVLTGDTKHDYINASYIDSYNTEKSYIASQGPKKNTVRDFWHMIWQENVGKIVMVTQIEEERRKKCEQYWPQALSRPMGVDNYRLTITEETYHTVYVYRLLTIYSKRDQQERQVFHFHFTNWPDHGVADSINLGNFYRKVKAKQIERNGPMVVHCSAGVGRTGTFVAIDALYEHGKEVGYVDVMEYVTMMRKDRMNMIQTHEQYEAVFDVLLELFTVPQTAIRKSEFCRYIENQGNQTIPQNQKMYRLEFQLLTLRPSYSAEEYQASRLKENITKNTTNVLAHDKFRPFLMSYGKSRNDYINAVIIPGYFENSVFFATQCPLEETVLDFLTMISDHDSKIIVLLDSSNKNALLWPEKDEMLEFEDFTIVHERASTRGKMELILNHKKQKEKRTIIVFTLEEWEENTIIPPTKECMLELLQLVINCWEKGKCPITVVCCNGCSKCGLFVAMKLILEKMEIDDEVDVFQIVRAMQIRRPEFFLEFDQYEYCYKCINKLLEGDSLYANV
ncbi:receptor-type tyrosine-protein phosphatase epsilon-like [Mytilus californianus]|uniref:receptor-type tyrosine-protein phosphatase epsilon-like n=1 Tax=Mytilus californianus TaxID=6549 RepID=UPI002245729B|nr:receptor-type tyrosine-protein phosphatase epsilon-like [Mytilus californianus]